MDELLANLEQYINNLGFFPLVFIVGAFIFTFTWTALSERLKLILLFIVGFIIFGNFLETIFTEFQKTQLSKPTILIISGVLGGLLNLGLYVMFRPFPKILAFIGGAGFSCLVFLAHVVPFIQIESREILITIIAIVSGVFGGICLALYTVIFKIPAIQIITSSLGGAIGITFLLKNSNHLSNWELGSTEILGMLEYFTKNDFPMILFICIAAILSQSFLYYFFRKRLKAKSLSTSTEKVESNDTNKSKVIHNSTLSH